MKTKSRFEPFKVYSELKPNYPGTILLIRCNREYKCFNSGAELVMKFAASVKSPGIQHKQHYECSFPAGKADQVISELAKAGFRIGVCDAVDERSQ